MVTARVIVTDALDLLGVHAAEEPLTAHQEQQGLRVLNDLIQNASLEQFLVYYMEPTPVPCPTGTLMLTWGVGGEIPTPRPLQIGLEAYRTDGDPPTTAPVAVVSLAEFHALRVPLPQSGAVQCVAYAANLPLGELWVWPVPREPTTLTLYPWQVLRSWDDFDAEVLLPPGYERFLKPATAVDLAPYYDKQPSETVVAMRSEAKNNVKTVNVTIPLLDVPWFADPFMRTA